MEFIYPDRAWYTKISEQNEATPFCPHANVHRCPRYYSSLYLLGEAGITTKITPEKINELDEFWEKSELLPVVAEHDTMISGHKSGFSNFCPEVTFDMFGLFAVSLHRYSDEIDKDMVHEQLKKKAHPKDWRWHWQNVEPLHYLKCPIYSQLISKPVIAFRDSSTKNVNQNMNKNSLFIKNNNNLKNFLLDKNAGWKTIKHEFGITKREFGKRLYFINDKFKRNLIFRDVEHAYILASFGFFKPAVILAGGVIEELLRQYLIHKNKSPKKDTFDEYIKCCENNGLLKSAISRLSDSVRQFRNLVHIVKEESRKHTISKATAKGAVSSIFTISNEFQE